MPIVVPVAIGVAGMAVDTVAGTGADTVMDTVSHTAAAGTAMDTLTDTVSHTAAVGTATDTVAHIAADTAVDSPVLLACNPCFASPLWVLFVYYYSLPVHALQFKLSIITE